MAETMPKRIQRQRTKGWRMPAGAVYVGRPTKWGNPYHWQRMRGTEVVLMRARVVRMYAQKPPDAALFEIEELRGKDLACWCPLDEPCHADVLLEWANG